VDELDVDGVRHLSWDEAVEREFTARLRLYDGLERASIGVRGSTEEEPLGAAGLIVRTWEALEGSVEVRAENLDHSLYRLTVRVANETPWVGSRREDAQRRTFCSTHVVLRSERAAFVSQTDPPDRLGDAAAASVNIGVWPVLVGPAGSRDTMLAAPIILEDYAQIAPESPGDLFDAGEIDRLLILNVLSLTEKEQEEMRATDPRAREILDRCAGLSPEELLPLHGAIRDFRPANAE
jgi:hypothetical protein